MPIDLKCTCGRALFLRDELAGRQIRCPECQALLLVPAASAAPKQAEAVPPPLPTAVRAAPKYDPLGERSQEADEVLEVEAAEPMEPPPPKAPPPTKGQFGTSRAGIGGGIVMILIAVVWFGVGMAFGRIFIYPPILFVLGLVAVIRAVVTRNEG